MKNVFIFTPTNRYGGLDVAVSCLKKAIKHDTTQIKHLYWYIADELYEERVKARDFNIDIDGVTIIHSRVQKQNGMKRNLASSYQSALDKARSVDADLFISLQDYIWFPEDGIQQFIDFSFKEECLMTGLCHHSLEPSADKIVNNKGLFTVFDEPWSGDKPQGRSWTDVRESGNLTPYATDPIRWEINWGAITREPLHDESLNFDISYDSGIAYENQDYSLQARMKGYSTYQLEGNVAISFPHRSYWPEETEINDGLTQINMKKHHEKWHLDMPH